MTYVNLASSSFRRETVMLLASSPPLTSPSAETVWVPSSGPPPAFLAEMGESQETVLPIKAPPPSPGARDKVSIPACNDGAHDLVMKAVALTLALSQLPVSRALLPWSFRLT